MSGIDETITLAGRPFRLREVTIEDAPAVLALFEEVFGERPPEGWYAWKYGEAGLQGRALGLWDEQGALVAHCAGFPRTLLWHGRTVAAIQIGDVMVAPKVRGLLTRRGPFFMVCETFFRYWIGAAGRSRCLMAFQTGATCSWASALVCIGTSGRCKAGFGPRRGRGLRGCGAREKSSRATRISTPLSMQPGRDKKRR